MIKKAQKDRQGYTFTEVMVSALILGVVIIGLIQMFIYNSTLTDLSSRMTTVISEAQNRMELVRNTAFSSIPTSFPSGTVYNLNDPNGNKYGELFVYRTTINSDLYEIKIAACWRNKRINNSASGGRVIGEDQNLNGILDAGEDLSSPANNQVDSMVTLISRIAKK